MKQISDFSDIHSHYLTYRDDTIVNLDHNDEIPSKGFYSIGIHPWKTNQISSQDLNDVIDNLRVKAANRQIVAIGECGLDKLRGNDMEFQILLFKHQIDISEQLHKPLIIHAVRAFHHLIRIKKEMRPSQQWIIHGFRGNPHMTKELIMHGFYLSLGEKFNEYSAKVIPASRLYYETDESELSIGQIKNIINECRCQ